MKPATLWCTVGCALALVVSCDRTDSKAAPAAEPAAPGGAGPITYPTTLPGKGTHALLGHAVRGGSGDTRPSLASRHLSEPATNRGLRKPSQANNVDCTQTKMDNAAECEGDNLYFCDDSSLWVVECSAETRLSGLKGGSCYEGEGFTNCLGCAKADDGTDVCCDFELTVCCAADGTCYNPKG